MTATLTRKVVAAVGALAVLCLGIWWGGHPSELPSFLRSAFVANPRDVVIGQALSDIQNDYYHAVGRGSLIDGAISGAVATLNDPYARYQTPQEFYAFNNPPPQRVTGIGIGVAGTREGLSVQNVVPGSPAAIAGLQAGDVIVAVDGHALAGLGAARAIGLVRGRVGSVVRLVVRRGSRRLRLSARRAIISEPIVVGVEKHYSGVPLGVISLPTLDVPGVHGEVAQSLQTLLHQHVTGVVLDLRGDGGGLVSEAQLVVSLFLRHGVIVTTRGRTQSASTLYATGNPLAPSVPLVVLVNQDTASSAEIVAGALKDHHRAVVVGTRTYGKGVFQEIRPLANGGAIDVTVGQYFLPNGENLGAGGFRRGSGITPDVTVSAAPTATSDPQLAAALRILAARAH